MPAKKKIKIDTEDFTLGEMELLEKNGIGTEQIAAGSFSSMTGYVWLYMLRLNPEATLDEARAVKLREFDVVEGETGPDPTPAS
jgi:hypothetical protein